MADNKFLIEEQYKLLFNQINSLINNENPLITNLSNIVAAINQSFDKISWIGFYFAKNDQLFLGPFQGKVACTRIEFGRGVCGTAVATKLSQVVPDVHEFPGHIICDADSNSEIVIPILVNNEIFGVLDLDSTKFSAFTTIDQLWLEKICNLLTEKLNFKKNILT